VVVDPWLDAGPQGVVGSLCPLVLLNAGLNPASQRCDEICSLKESLDELGAKWIVSITRSICWAL
jgi:hypothetical protein